MQCAYHPGRDVVGACVNCGKLVCAECEVPIGGKVHCKGCVDSLLSAKESNLPPANTSGQGKTGSVPPEIAGWNWGAFLLGWIWGVGHDVWISLVCLMPGINIVFAFVLGAKGNQWAWQNRKWDSVEHFKKRQRTWAWVGLALAILWVLLVLLFIAWMAWIYWMAATEWVNGYPTAFVL